MFKLDYEVVEGKQHDDALEGLVGEHVIQYLYSEFDDGKDVLVKPPHEMWEEVKARVPFDSRRWFPTSVSTFGKELVRLKQAMAYKDFDVDRGTVGTGNNKKRAIKVTRIDAAGTAWDSSGTAEIASSCPSESGVDKPKSAPSKEVGTGDSESAVPLLSQETGLPSHGNGMVTTDEGVQEAIRKLKGDK